MAGLARAQANIALVKYWGKRDAAANLPATGSLSLTLAGFSTRTRVEFEPAPGPDLVLLDGRPADAPTQARVQRFLDRVRARAGLSGRARVETRNTFPTAAGLASSASGFAALAGAAAQAAGLDLAPAELAALARLGSASAARSIYGGFVEMDLDGATRQLVPPEAWDVCMVVALTADSPKRVSSTDGMLQTAACSPYYPAWLASAPADLAAARAAVQAHDLAALGEVAEASCLKMHACALAARPGILYWNGVTVEVMRAVRSHRAAGLPVWFTIDAGPHVKALCAAADSARVAAVLAVVPGVFGTQVATPGPGLSLGGEDA
jgi:diphosphomevalonate decarboxylase